MRWNGAFFCEYYGKSMETETITWSKFPNGEKAIVEQILASEKINKSKRAGLWEPVWDMSRKVNHLSKVVWPEQVSQSLWWTLKSPKTNILSEGLIERTSSMLDEIESKTKYKDEEGERWGKRSKTLSEVKPVENISKNLQSFLEISPVQKEVLL